VNDVADLLAKVVRHRLRAISYILEHTSFRYADEAELQAGIAQALDDMGFAAQREVRLTPASRIDFLYVDVHGHRIGIEVKIAGAPVSVGRQLARYAPHVDGLVLATTRRTHAQIPTTLGGKPVRVAILGRHA
jgi:hypothetical protein